MKKIILFLILSLFVTSTALSAPAVMYVTPAGAGAKDGAAWASAMGYAEFETDVEASAEAGDIYYVAGGTYTLTSDFVTALDGTADAPIYIIGVKSGTTNEPPVASDYPTVAEIRAGTDGPLFTDGASAYTFDVDDFWIVKNARVESGDLSSFSLGVRSIAENVSSINDGAATRNAFNLSGYNIVLKCEAVSTNGNAVNMAGGFHRILFNYIHDSAVAINPGSGDSMVVIGNFLDTNPIGFNAGNGSTDHTIINNTIYNDNSADAGSIGIESGTTNTAYALLNNIITGFETGIANDDAYSNSWISDYNDLYDCGTDRTNLAITSPTRSINDIDVDPTFGNAANGDFSISAAGVVGDGVMATDGN